jgi:hypothetical protein
MVCANRCQQHATIFADTCGVVIDRKSMKPRIYPATDDGTLTGKPVFLSQERWNQLKNDQRSTVSAQLLLNPIASDEATFSSLWLTPYDVNPAVMNVYVLVDPSWGKLSAPIALRSSSLASTRAQTSICSMACATA